MPERRRRRFRGGRGEGPPAVPGREPPVAPGPEPFPLTSCAAGDVVRVVGVSGRGRWARRLQDMGLNEQMELRVVNAAEGGGPVIVAVGMSRIAIERSLAHHVMVVPADDTSERLLSHLTQGQEGIVKRVEGTKRVKRRLQEMGFVAGAHVRVEKFAPLKDPAEYVIHNYHVSLRRQEAAMIVLEPDVPNDGQ